MGEVGRERPQAGPRLGESPEKAAKQASPDSAGSDAERAIPTSNTEQIVEQVVANIKIEGNGAAFVEVMDDADIDALAARYFEKGIELDPLVKRSIRNAVRRAFGLPERTE